MSKSLEYDPNEAFKARKTQWSDKKYTSETPIDVLADALVADRVKAGFDRARCK